MKKLFPLTLPVIILFLAGCADTGSTEILPPPPSIKNSVPPDLSPDEIALGNLVYASSCAECHGANLEGEADWKQQNEDGSFRYPPHSADGHTWHHADSVLINAIKKGGSRFVGMNIGGSSDMPAYAGRLTDEEIIAVLAFIKSTWPEDIRAMQWQQTQKDQQNKKQ